MRKFGFLMLEALKSAPHLNDTIPSGKKWLEYILKEQTYDDHACMVDATSEYYERRVISRRGRKNQRYSNMYIIECVL